MKIIFKKAQMIHLEDCKTALLNSRLGEEYFPSEEDTLASLTEGIQKGEVTVVFSESSECVGFMWVLTEGAFHSFPYLHIIAVKESFRGKGIGGKMLEFLEKTIFPENSKVFLVVADFNPEAKRLYERVGYRQVGAIPGLYKPGVTEYLMMKERGEEYGQVLE